MERRKNTKQSLLSNRKLKQKSTDIKIANKNANSSTIMKGTTRVFENKIISINTKHDYSKHTGILQEEGKEMAFKIKTNAEKTAYSSGSQKDKCTNSDELFRVPSHETQQPKEKMSFVKKETTSDDQFLNLKRAFKKDSSQQLNLSKIDLQKRMSGPHNRETFAPQKSFLEKSGKIQDSVKNIKLKINSSYKLNSNRNFCVNKEETKERNSFRMSGQNSKESSAKRSVEMKNEQSTMSPASKANYTISSGTSDTFLLRPSGEGLKENDSYITIRKPKRSVSFSDVQHRKSTDKASTSSNIKLRMDEVPLSNVMYDMKYKHLRKDSVNRLALDSILETPDDTDECRQNDNAGKDSSTDIKFSKGEAYCLSESTLVTGLSCLAQGPNSQGYVYTKLELKEKNLNEISKLQFYSYLKSIDLSWNELTDVSALGHIPYLQNLNLAHNRLTKLLDFKPPQMLTHVDYSFNRIWKVGDLSEFWSLQTLNVSHNRIKSVTEISILPYLMELNLSCNEITRLDDLNFPKLKILNCENNSLCDFNSDLSCMGELEFVYLNNNKLKSLNFLYNVKTLMSLNMQNNQLSNLFEVEKLKRLTSMKELSFVNNLMTLWPKYRELVLFTIPSLTILDGFPVTAQEKVQATITFCPITRAENTNKHAFHLLLEHLRSPEIMLDTIPVDQPPYPFVILVGPPSSGKAYLLKKMKEEFGNKVYIGVHYTTHSPPRFQSPYYPSKIISEDDFLEMVMGGQFFTSDFLFGKCYGFSRNELAEAIRRGSACLTGMWLREALLLSSIGIKPYFVLVIPEDEALHLSRISLTYDLHRISSVRTGAFEIRVPKCNNLLTSTTISSTIEQNVVDKVVLDSMKDPCLSKSSVVESSTFTISRLFEHENNHSSTSELNESGNELSFSDSRLFELSDSVIERRAKSHSDSSSSSLDISKFKEYIESYCLIDSTQGSSTSPLSGEVSVSPENASQTVASFSDVSSDSLSKVRNLYVISEESEEPESLITILEENNFKESSVKGIVDADCLEQIHKIEIKMRKSYFNIIREKPQFFDEVIFTDDLENAACKLKKFLRKQVFRHPFKYPLFSMENDPLYKNVTKSKLQSFNI